MKEVLQKVAKECVRPAGAVLDFGAGKLRNALYLLKRGYRVCGVEFADLEKTAQGTAMYGLAKQRYPRFWSLVYPNGFLADRGSFDLILLINVLNIMPVPSERLLVIQQAYNKLRAGGHALWYSQYGDEDYKRRCTPAVRCGDGYYVGRNRRYKTFYREFSAGEMDSLMLANGFEVAQTFAVPRNHVRLYRKTKINPFGQALTLADLRREVPRDESIALPEKKRPRVVKRSRKTAELRPDPAVLSVERTFSTRLEKLRPGPAKAGEYHALMMSILSHLFVPERITRIKKEAELFEGRKRIDLLCRTGKTGFFSDLNRDYSIRSPYVVFECKNYASDPKNPEFDQLLGRLGTTRGDFGVLLCRTINNRKAVIQRCRDATAQRKFVLVLCDSDMRELLELRLQQRWKEIDEFLDLRMDELL